MGAMINEPARQPSIVTSVPLPQYAQDILDEFKPPYAGITFAEAQDARNAQLAEASSPPQPLERQVGGNHYQRFGIQPIEYILANGLDFCQGNVVKLVTRYRDKGGIEDLDKAIHYLEFLKTQARGEDASTI